MEPIHQDGEEAEREASGKGKASAQMMPQVGTLSVENHGVLSPKVIDEGMVRIQPLHASGRYGIYVRKQNRSEVQEPRYVYGETTRIDYYLPYIEAFKRSGYKKKGDFIQHLLRMTEEYEKHLKGKGGNLRPFTPDVFETSVPILLTGEPGSGKTTTAKRIVETKRPVFVLDILDEYNEVQEKIDERSVRMIKWKNRDQQIRLVPPTNLRYRKSALRYAFDDLHELMESRVLSDWYFVFDEAHNCVSIPSFRSFISEARKYTRKVIVITNQRAAFEGMMLPVFGPPPH